MYSYSKYLAMLKLAKRSEQTIKSYGKVLRSYARFLGIPVEVIHLHLTPENLILYANSRVGFSERGTRLHLSVLHRYFMINKVHFDPLELNVLKAQRREDSDDKPLSLEILQQMMDLGTPHTRAILATLISTGMRVGECSQLLLTDLTGDTIHIRPEIAKGRRGGDVYLTSESREFIDLWLKDRNRYIRTADKRNTFLIRSGYSVPRERDDKRLFACAYSTILRIFSNLYDKVDGEQGKYHAKITPHSTRKYFRTNAVRTMPLDLVEKIMRHSGYLTDSYVRITEEEARKMFHAGERVLYITRADHRATRNEIETLKQDSEKLEKMELELEKIKQEREEFKAMANLMSKYLSEQEKH